jgi:hypothetical protein
MSDATEREKSLLTLLQKAGKPGAVPDVAAVIGRRFSAEILLESLSVGKVPIDGKITAVLYEEDINILETDAGRLLNTAGSDQWEMELSVPLIRTIRRRVLHLELL